MSTIQESWYSQYLVCPDCKATLYIENNIQCSVCEYEADISSTVEIKPQKPLPLNLELPRKNSRHANDYLKTIDIRRPEMTYKGPSAIRDSSELMSEIQKYLKSNGAVLDLGCGPRDQAESIEYLGHKYVGVDYTNENADFLADAHCIPFKDSTFDCVLSYAVLEHLHNPFVALHEIERVLKPCGIYVGTVSQGEPFHDSYFHLTPWGFISLVSSASKLEIKRLWASHDTLRGLVRMGKYPRVIRLLLAIVDKIHLSIPILAPRKMRWSKEEKRLDVLYKTASICFVVQKSAHGDIG